MSINARVERREYRKIKDVLSLPNLIEMQLKSYHALLQRDVSPAKRKRQGLQAVLDEVFPVESHDGMTTLEIVNYDIAPPKYDVDECQRRGMTFAGTLKVRLRLIVRDKTETGKEVVRDVREQEVYLGEFPLMTETGTFIINGAERVIVSQLHRSPGVYFEEKTLPGGKHVTTARIIPYRGAWVDFELDSSNVISVSIDRKRKLPVTSLLYALGCNSESEILKIFHETEMVDAGRELVDRIPVEDVKDPSDGSVIAEARQPVAAAAVGRIRSVKIRKVEVLVGMRDDLYLVNTLDKDYVRSREEALLEIYRRVRPGDPASMQNAEPAFERMFFNPRTYDLAQVGRYKLNRKLNLSTPSTKTVLTRDDFIQTIRYLIGLSRREGVFDNIDHLGNRRVRTVGELVQNQFRVGMARMERSIRERMTIQDMDTCMPHNLVNPKLVTAAIRDFFGRSQLSQFMDQTNPLAELTHKRRLSALGPGGLSRERAGFEVRDVHFSHYGRICPIETPEGPNIGLISSLSAFARISSLGFLETPYRTVAKHRASEQIEWLSADMEEEHVIAQANARLDSGSYFTDPKVLSRFREEFLRESRDRVEYMDVSPLQLVSVSASLIPFLEHDDANRALMGCNMQRQAVPLLVCERPIVATGMEGRAARDSGVLVLARDGGVVESSCADAVTVRRSDGMRDRYTLKRFSRSNQSTCLDQRPVVLPGERVTRGQMLADGPATRDGELALGRNVLVAFMPWGGHNFEDAILISEKMVKNDSFTSIHIEEFELESRDTKLGKEEVTRDIPNVGEEALKDLDDGGIIRIGAEVKPGDILVGKVTPKSETELSPEEKLLRAIFGEKAADVRDASLTAPPGIGGIVVDVKVFSRKDKEDKARKAEQAEIDRIRSQYEVQMMRLGEAKNKKLSTLLLGKHLAESFLDEKTGTVVAAGGKKISSSLLATMSKFDLQRVRVKEDDAISKKVDELLDFYERKLMEVAHEEGKEVEHVRRGDELPAGVNRLVKVYVASKRKISVGDKVAGRHGNKGVVAKILAEEDMPFMPDGTPVEVVLNPLGVPSRMNLGQILETHLGWAARALGLDMITPVFNGATEIEIKDALREAGLPASGKSVLLDGRTGKRFDQDVTVGYIYMMKLSHLVDDKVHARSIGPYSLVTQQPLGGKAQFGGQRLGEMEVWALEAYGAAYTLQELLTVKSDDVEGRARIYEAIVKGENTLQPGVPESFNVLIKELQALGLDFRTEKRKKVGDVFSGQLDGSRFDAVSIGIASPQAIRSWSRGEVKKPETINYRTFKPEKDGLFCERIFGPTRDWECNCGKFKRIKHKGVVCDRCGVEVTQSKVRRERMGHINLATPVTHIWFFKVVSSRIGALLEMGMRALERVIYYEQYVVISPGGTKLKKKQLLTEEEYLAAREEYGEKFTAKMGAEAVRILLKELDLEELCKEIRAQIKKATSKQKILRLGKRLRVVEAFRRSGNKPEWMVMDVISVLPPDLRPLVPLDGGRFATSDLNDLYRRVINRNARLKHLLELNAPDVIIRNEKRMLQEAVDALFDNGRHGRAVMGPGNRALKSLSDMLKGKQGRFRQNLLGKRVDYSGRSVIVVGPDLKLHQCGLPKKMALELFEPFIIRRLKEKGYVHTIKSAKKMVERVRPEVWDILDEVIRDHPVLLNRAPTLHRLGIQAFEPVLTEGKAIRIHPLVCSAFNADFDGDQMAVHVPLSMEAQLESHILMLSTNNVFSPANGKPITVPTQDIVLGCCYLNREKAGARGEGSLFCDPNEALLAHELGGLDLHARIRVRMNESVVTTTAGRIIFNNVLPPGMAFVNREMDKSQLSNVIFQCYHSYGHAETVRLLDSLKDLGFERATLGGISIGVDDIRIPPEKAELISKARAEESKIFEQYQAGIITDGERYNKIIDIWTRTTDELSDVLFEGLKEDGVAEKSGFRGFNPIFMMADSGARGSKLQIRQLAGMRGLMAKPSGEIIESPITASFREGLTVLEYFISTHGARKGLADTALKTADSGYLTRRLVDVAQDVIVSLEDCGTINGLTASGIYEGEEIVITLGDRILGRTALEDVKVPLLGNVIVKAGEEIDDEKASVIVAAGIDSVRIRSVLYCEAPRGVCSKCYGRNLATGRMVGMGDPVGIVAAQSIGEPGTQLTMRTFHIGGTARRIIERSRIAASAEGTVHYDNVRSVRNRQKDLVVLNRSGMMVLHDDKGAEIEKHRLLIGSVVRAEEDQRVVKGDICVEWDPYTVSILTEIGGQITYEDIIEGVTMRKEYDRATRHTRMVVIDHKEDKHPQIVIRGAKGEALELYSIPTGAHLMVRNGATVEAGDLIAMTPREITGTKDITGGLPRVAELFEARRPRDPAIVTEIDGIVELGGTVKGMRNITVKSDSGMEKSYLIPPGKHLNVHAGDRVSAGQKLIEGPKVLDDILRIQGERALQEYLLNEVQEVYRLQGVEINDKHIETIIRQMLRKVEVELPGDTRFLPGEQVDRFVFRDENERVRAEGEQPATAGSVLLGITKASLTMDSFIAAASFQETTRVLTDAAASGRRDELRGLKENVIMGHLIPAGTGLERYRKMDIVKVAEDASEEAEPALV